METIDKDLIDLQEYIVNTFRPNVKRNTEIVKADIGNPYMFHGSINGNIKEFVPRLAERYAKSEDRTVPRVHVSDNLIGCLEGMNELIWYLSTGYYNGTAPKEVYKGGWYIYSIPFKYAIKPNNELVFDSIRSNEHWLVPYNKEHRTYKGTITCKLIVTAITHLNNGIDKTKSSISMVLEIMSGSIKITKNGKLYQKGYYEITFYPRNKLYDGHYTTEIEEDQVLVRSISKSEYDQAKNTMAPNLFTNTNSKFTTW